MKEENQPPSSDIGASQGIVDWVVKCFHVWSSNFISRSVADCFKLTVTKVALYIELDSPKEHGWQICGSRQQQ